MRLSRYNRFERPGRSFHYSPLGRGGGESSRGDDVELGSYLHKQPQYAIREEEVEEEEGGHFVASDPETAAHHSSSFHARFPADRLKGRRFSMLNHAARAKPGFLRKWICGKRHRWHQCRARPWCRVAFLLKATLMTLGLLQIVTFISGLLGAIFPDDLDLVRPFHPPHRHDAWTADVQPLKCHSHNDYWRREPLFNAIRVGCTSVEADIWHFDGELYVAHKIPGIRPNRTLKNMYLDPLREILDRKRENMPAFLEKTRTSPAGVFDTNPEQSLILLIDFKNDPDVTWDLLKAQLTPFRDRGDLTYFNGTAVVDGPLTIVVSGDAPFDRVVANSSSHRDIFYDAPLALMSSISSPSSLSMMTSPTINNNDPAMVYSASNSYYASASFVKAIGFPWHSSLTQAQLDLLRRQIRGAHACGLKVRYWGVPAWPVGLRNYLWRVLVREGVDYLSVDHIDDVTKGDWGPRKGGWGKKWWR